MYASSKRSFQSLLQHRCQTHLHVDISAIITSSAQIFRALLHLTFLYLLLYYRNVYSLGYPLFFEGLFQVSCAEYNRRKQRVRQEAGKKEKREEKKCVAAVVGYREDPTVFRKCLLSYRADYDQCTPALFVGIDGDEEEDLKMVGIADEVFGKELIKIHIPEPFGELALKMTTEMGKQDDKYNKKGTSTDHKTKYQKLEEEKNSPLILAKLIKHATAILLSHGILSSPAAKQKQKQKRHRTSLKPICIYQPHVAKKEIMFTTLIFSLAYAQAQHINFIWSSDSDSWIYPHTLQRVIEGIVSDKSIAGACTSHHIHNGDASVVARMVAATYEADLGLTTGVLGAFDVVDCQSGPCALFRADALAGILVPWYGQTVLGKRPIVNEDRHLTTRLHMSGKKVAFNSLAVVATDTPSTFARWSAQQIRWSRAPALESLSNPRLFLLHHPLLFLYATRRFLVPLLNFHLIITYLITGHESQYSSAPDIAMRFLLFSAYATWRYETGLMAYALHAFSQTLLQLPQAAYMLWACLTVFDDSWGTPMRSSAEQKEDVSRNLRRETLGSWSVTTAWLSLVGASFARWFAASFVPGLEGLVLANFSSIKALI